MKILPRFREPRYIAMVGSFFMVGVLVASLAGCGPAGSLAMSKYQPKLAAGYSHMVELKSNDTVVAVEGNWYGQCDVGEWTGIVQVATGRSHTLGLKADGIVVAAGPWAELAKWNLG